MDAEVRDGVAQVEKTKVQAAVFIHYAGRTKIKTVLTNLRVRRRRQRSNRGGL